ncbi:transcription initiation factor TFIID subunit 7-like [Phragmites australis]|uniref:transcription initiation factor TFIID subunit 7-like n=1 Tax=Phragmites australis TaxID=29695 RepID=UPI002D76A1CF|nr:transcription initiation factor TFIID subunit 7-like [Phragmites australis]
MEERIERLMNESAAASSSNSDEASLDLLRSGTENCNLVTFWTYDDSVLIKTADIGQMIMVRGENDPAPEGVEYKHGLTPPMRDACRQNADLSYTMLQAELVNQVEKHLINIMHGVSNANVIGGEEGSDRKKAAVARATKLDVPEPAAIGEEAEPERSDSDSRMSPWT